MGVAERRKKIAGGEMEGAGERGEERALTFDIFLSLS